jgi:hypothetical protein
VQVALVFDWIILLASTSKLAQPVANEYLRNSASLEIMTVSSIITALNPITLVMPMVWLQALFQSQHLLLPSDSADSSGSSGGGCVYNPNAPASNSPCCLYNI